MVSKYKNREVHNLYHMYFSIFVFADGFLKKIKLQANGFSLFHTLCSINYRTINLLSVMSVKLLHKWEGISMLIHTEIIEYMFFSHLKIAHKRFYCCENVHIVSILFEWSSNCFHCSAFQSIGSVDCIVLPLNLAIEIQQNILFIVQPRL